MGGGTQYPVLTESELKDVTYDFIVIACGAFSLVRERLIYEYDVPSEKIVGFIFEEERFSQKLQSKLSFWLEEEMQRSVLKPFLRDVLLLPPFFAASMWWAEVDREIVKRDFVREQTLSLLASEIKRKKVAGNVAELGVYRGEFSGKINRLFQDRTLYLFDTFSGFDERDLTRETQISNKAEVGSSFRETAVSAVLANMPYPEKCVIKKGYFPETFDLDTERFSLVSIDADLYDPIYQGLQQFYPRLERGGYIMVHDYHNALYEGAKRAVIAYCNAQAISYVPIADFAGSIVITKSV